MNQETASVSVSDILADIQGITLFLDSEEGDHAADGNAIMALRHPALTLKRGEVDVFIVFPHQEEGRFNAGWIGGGDFMSEWLETSDGLIIDPWLDERLRSAPNAETTVMEHIPVILRSRRDEGAIGYLHQEGSSIEPSERQRRLHGRYVAWMDSGEMENRNPTRVRTVLQDGGFEKLAPHSRWAQAVIAADQRGIPPTRARHSIESKAAAPTTPSDERTIEERLAAMGLAAGTPEYRKRKDMQEKQDVAREVLTTMATKQPLSWKKVMFAILLGLAIGWVVVALFS